MLLWRAPLGEWCAKELHLLTESCQGDSMHPFVGFIMDRQTYTYRVYCVNPTSLSFHDIVKVMGGAHRGVQGIIDTRKTQEQLGPLPAMSLILLEENHWNQLDSLLWGNLDFYPVSKNPEPYRYYFELPRYGSGYENGIVYLPVLQTTGMIIHLKARRS